MKTWKLLAIISNTPLLRCELEEYDYMTDLPLIFVRDILEQCIEKFSFCVDGYLRTVAANYSFDIITVEELSALGAFDKFGGEAVFQAIDKGSYKVTRSHIS